MQPTLAPQPSARHSWRAYLNSGMGDWVLIKHEMPDGSWHLDWLFERDATAPSAGLDDRGPTHGGAERENDRVLLSFRIEPAPPGVALFDPFRPDLVKRLTERIADHRRLYLTFEGEIGGPAVSAPEHTGMGTQLLKRQRGLDQVELHYRPGGGECSIAVAGVRA